MKKLIVLFLSVMTSGLLLTSCSDDDESGSSIEGKWDFFQVGISALGQEILEPYEHQEGCDKDNLNFKSGGVLDAEEFFNNGEGCDSDIEIGSWAKSGSTLTFTFEGELVEATIVTLDSSTLKLNVSEEFEGQPLNLVLVLKRP